MKKLMIVAAVAMAALASQAGAFKWATGGTGSKGMAMYLNDTVTATPLATWANLSGSGTTLGTITDVYLFDAAVTSQTKLLSELRGADNAATAFASLAKVDSTALNASSKITQTESGAYGTIGKDYDIYFGIVATDLDGNAQVYVSTTKTASVLDGKAAEVTWSDLNSNSSWKGGVDTAYAGAGWYGVTAAAVPEPTSGLLLLLGVAGLALRRRRA